MGKLAVIALAAAAALACGGGDEGDGIEPLTRAELLDPESCRGCHPIQFRDWSGSMHAYAADDPVFLAMNRRGQEETGGELGDFCVQCHAPMALREGATFDGLNLDEVDQSLKGVTCYFCHTASEVTGTHNNPIELADDLVMRGGFDDPKKTGAHQAGYSPLLDSERFESSDMCGSCHDIVTQSGVHLERTFLEYKESVFSKPLGAVATTCSTCHMFTQTGQVADVDGVKERRLHSHAFPGVDVALIDWPERDTQRRLIQRDLDATVLPRLCINPAAGGIEIDVILDNVNAGHAWTSGSAFDRRAWVQVEAFEGQQRVYASGDVGPEEAVVDVADSDDDLWQIRDFTYKEDGEVAHFFWEVATIDSQLLPPAVTNDPQDPDFIHSVERSYAVTGANPDRVTLRVFIRPLGYDVFDELITSGHLADGLQAQMPTFELGGAALEWTSDAGFGCVPQ